MTPLETITASLNVLKSIMTLTKEGSAHETGKIVR